MNKREKQKLIDRDNGMGVSSGRGWVVNSEGELHMSRLRWWASCQYAGEVSQRCTLETCVTNVTPLNAIKNISHTVVRI